jgi:hypothetical protein
MGRFGRSWGRQTVVKVLGGEIKFRFDDVHADQWGKLFEEIGLAMEDMEPVFDEFGRYMVEENIPQTFAKRGRPRRWAMLSERYAMRRFGRRRAVATLVLTGKMKRSFRWKAFPRSMRIENSRRYWLYHQLGAPRAHLPQRVIVQLLRQDRSKFLDIAHEHVYDEPRDRSR